MIKKLLLFGSVAMFFVACNNNQATTDETNANDSTQVETQQADTEEIAKIAIDDFDSLAENYVNKKVQVEGTCVHTCKHGGGKMHLIGSNPDNRLVIMATDESGKFNADMEGSKFIVIGIIEETRIDSAYLANWESEVLAGEEDHKEGIKHKHGAEGDDATEAEEREMKLAQIDGLRKQIAESGKDHLSFYNLKCVSYEEVKE